MYSFVDSIVTAREGARISWTSLAAEESARRELDEPAEEAAQRELDEPVVAVGEQAQADPAEEIA